MFGAKPVAAALFLLVIGAGCLTADPDDSSDDGPDVPEPAYVLDCTIAPGMGGDWWPQPCIALASPNPSTAKVEVDIAVNPRDSLNVVVASKDKDPLASDNCVWSVAQVTKDGGKTWTTVYVGGDREHRVPETQGYECVTDPIMTFDQEGVFYYALQIYNHSPRNPPSVPVVGTPDTGSAFILARSRDGGLTFEKYTLQAPGLGDFVFHDYPRMLVTPTGAIHTIWNAYTTVGTSVPGQGFVGEGRVNAVISTSRDGGETVDPPVILREDSQEAVAFFSGFAATKDGTIYVTIEKDGNSDAGAATDVWFWKSADDAQTFFEVGNAFQILPTPRQHGNHSFRTPPFVEMAADASDGSHSGRLYTFWPEWVDEQSDILSRYSDDGGVTWSEPVGIATETKGGQYFMRPKVGDDGRVFVTFTSQAYSGSEFLDQVLAWSEDGGATWENLRLTNVSFDGDLGIHQDGFPFVGDYNGIIVDSDGWVHVAWGDTSTGRGEIAYARVKPTS